MSKKHNSDEHEEIAAHGGRSLLRKIGETAVTAFVTAAVGLITPHIMGPAPAPPPPSSIVIVMPSNSQLPGDQQKIQPQANKNPEVGASVPPLKTFSLTLFGKDGKALDQFDFLADESRLGPSRVVHLNPGVTGVDPENTKGGYFSISYQDHPAGPEHMIHADKDQVYTTLAGLPEMQREKIEQSFGQVTAVKIAPKQAVSAPPTLAPLGDGQS